jgi:hypothetical protein
MLVGVLLVWCFLVLSMSYAEERGVEADLNGAGKEMSFEGKGRLEE